MQSLHFLTVKMYGHKHYEMSSPGIDFEYILETM